MKILYIGESQTYELYKKGGAPSHWLYGAVEMQKEGNIVIFEEEVRSFFHDVILLIKYRPDFVFIPNLNLLNHCLLLLLGLLSFRTIKIYGYLHHEPKGGIKIFLSRMLLRGCKHLFFLSELTMNHVIDCDIISPSSASVPGWGPDMDFYGNIATSDGDYFVSTGKENRDFDLLIDVFTECGESLKIITSKKHGGQNYENLPDKCKDIPNIEVVITENTGDIYLYLIDVMAKSKALVCPLKEEKLNYCVGLSSIADAEGLKKPLIITRNLYHSANRLESFNVVKSKEDWLSAIANLKKAEKDSKYSMSKAYMNMKKYLPN